MRLLLVGNPASAAGRGRRRIESAALALRAQGATVELALTERPGHARRLVAGAAGWDRVVACGGDGLVSEVAGAIASAGPPLAVIPAGRGNDLARALGLPLDVASAARVALGGRLRSIDLGVASGATFTTVAACGLDAEISRAARVSRLPLPGAGVYVVELLRRLRRLPRLHARIVADGVALEQDLLLVAVANTPNYGGGFLIAPGARVDDGLLDACVIRAAGALRVLSLLPRVMAGRHVGLPEVTMLRAARLELACEEPMAVEADGEALTTTPCVFECLPRALTVVAPESP